MQNAYVLQKSIPPKLQGLPYVTYPNVRTINGLPNIGGVFLVAVNSSQKRIIGGQDHDLVYAAFVSRKGSLKPIANLPLGVPYGVAINSSGAAIIGGSSFSLPYAALISHKGIAATIQNLPLTKGIIYSIAINDSGVCLIAGFLWCLC
jgi:hypothetical protein